MVVIEPASDVARKQESRGLEPTTTTVAEETSSSNDVTVVTGDASDGFETASESEFNVADDDEHPHQLQGHPEEEQSRPRNDDSLEVSFHDDQSRQKALAEANDAKLEGNRLFGDGHYEEALLQYEVALQVTPDMPSSVEMRAACHANRALCFLKVGKYEETIKECRKALELNPNYVKALQRSGEAHEKLEHFEEAIADVKKVLELDQSDVQARRTINRLEPLAAEKREKMKQEMIDKLKEMGNSVLGRFGMSIDNFKAVRDPKTGSYSISFQR